MVDIVQLKNELMPGIEELINKVLDSKDETARRKALESAFEQAGQRLDDASSKIEELNSLVLAKDSEVDSLKEISESLKKEHASTIDALNKELSDKVKVFEDKFSERDSEVETLKKELAEAKEALLDIERDKVAAVRIETLKKEGVAYAKEEVLKAQFNKVRGMSDEDFDAYKAELVTLAAQIKEVASVTKDTQDVKDVVTKSAPPPDIKKGSDDAAALNVETASVHDRVADIGAALSKKMKELKEAKEI